jgi:hypothetical protein
MPHEGMVHALTEVRRALVPGGRLIDLRPVVSHPPVDVLGRGSEVRAGRLDDTSDLADQAACDRALELALTQGWLRRLGDERFSYRMYWESPQEMLDYVTSHWEGVEIPEDVVVRAQQLADVAVPPIQVRIGLTMSITSYVNLAPGAGALELEA